MKEYAVLTGDLIGSRELAPERLAGAMDRIRSLAAEFGEAHSGVLVGQPDVFRGDSWQMCLRDSTVAVTAAIFLRAGLKSEDLDSRVAVGVGTVTNLREEKISESTGPAFVTSGRVLDALAKDRALGFACATEPEPSWAHGISLWVAPLLDLLLSQWSQREAVAVYGALRQLTQQAIAELPAARTHKGKAPTRQAVQDALRRVGWANHVEPVLADVEKQIRAQATV